VAQDLRQLGAAELTGSTGSVGERGKPDAGPLIGRRFGHAASVSGTKQHISARVGSTRGVSHKEIRLVAQELANAESRHGFCPVGSGCGIPLFNKDGLICEVKHDAR
jgi:hypothetical protein